jgi:hypothetical protein
VKLAEVRGAMGMGERLWERLARSEDQARGGSGGEEGGAEVEEGSKLKLEL